MPAHLLLVLATAVALEPTASPEATPIRALIVTGYDHPAHDWRLSSPALREVLEKDRRFDVRIVEDPAFLASDALARYDVVVLHFMNWERPGPGPRAQANLQRFVAGGKGLVVVHFACGAFGDWDEYCNLAGRVWDRKNSHDPRGLFRVNLSSGNHAVTRGMRSFDTDDELYTCLTGKRPIHVLATARSTVTKTNHPMAFVFRYEAGRVFHTPLGHDARAIRMPGTAELLRRGCAWAAGRKPQAVGSAAGGGSSSERN